MLLLLLLLAGACCLTWCGCFSVGERAAGRHAHTAGSEKQVCVCVAGAGAAEEERERALLRENQKIKYKRRAFDNYCKRVRP